MFKSIRNEREGKRRKKYDFIIEVCIHTRNEFKAVSYLIIKF